MTQLYTDPFGPPWKLNWLRLMFNWRGSIFQFFWVEWWFSTTLCAVALLIWYYVVLKDATQDSNGVVEISNNTQYFMAAIGYVASRFQAALSLMLGFYTSTIYGRWWKVRDVEGVVLGRVNDLAVQIAGFVRDNDNALAEQNEGGGNREGDDDDYDEKKSDENNNVEGESAAMETSHEKPSCSNHGKKKVTNAAEVRLNLVRWLNLSHALAIGELYEKQPNDFTSLDSLVKYGLLTEKECQYMIETPRSCYAAPFVWFLDLLHELKDRGECGISDDTIIVFAGNITKIRGSLADLYMYRNIPVPLSYRQLVNCTVRLYMIIIAVTGGLSAVVEQDWSVTAMSPGIFWMVLPFFFEYFLFVGWLSLADALGNPLRVWADQFDYESYVRGVVLSSNVFIEESLKGSTSVSDLGEVTASFKERQRETLEKWSKYEDHDMDLVFGLKELSSEDHRKSGAQRVRANLTGF